MNVKIFIPLFHRKEEECEVTYDIECETVYEDVPHTHRVEICNEPLTRDCDQEGEIVCQNENDHSQL